MISCACLNFDFFKKTRLTKKSQIDVVCAIFETYQTKSACPAMCMYNRMHQIGRLTILMQKRYICYRTGSKEA